MTSIDERLDGLPDERRALLAKLLNERRAAERPEIPRGDGPQPLSDAQWQFYLLWQQDPDSGVYNVPIALRLHGEFDADAAGAALREIVRRHEILRTRYTSRGGEPGTVLGDHEGVRLELRDLSGLPEETREATARSTVAGLAARPFDLEAELPLRATLVKLADRDHVLLIDVHHIAIDAASSQILFSEFTAVYTAVRSDSAPEGVLPEPPIQYADYAGWQRSRAASGQLERGLEFWNTYLEGADTSLDLPTDRPRPARLALTGDRRWRHLSPELTRRIRAFSSEHGVTPFMTALTALGVVLRRQTGKREFLVGTSASNRPTAHTEALIGCFANTTVLRVRAQDSATVRDALHQVREDVTAAFDHQDVPFEKVVALRRPERTLAQNPLFQVMFVCPQLPGGGGLPGVTADRFEMHNGTARFDLEIALLDNPDGIDLFCEYATELFTPERIDALLGHLENALSAMIAAPDGQVTALSVLGETEHRRAAREWNDTAVDYPADRTVAGLFAARAAAHPDAPAVRAGSRTLDYAELDRRSTRLARLLARHGARPGAVIGVATERTADLPLTVLAVLKAGAACLPLDTSHPADRLGLMLRDSAAAAVLTSRSVAGRVPGTDAPVLVLEDLADELDRPEDPSDEPFVCPAAPGDLCYVIFTSGSTGRPKAVLLDQRGRINNFTDFNRRLGTGPGDAVLSVSSLGFDMTAYDVVGTLLAGATVVLPEPARERDPGHWLDLIRDHRITVWHSVPTLLGLLVDAAGDLGVDRLPTLRAVLLGGDWIPVTLPDRLRALSPDARVISLGGATEASMDSTLFEVGAVDPGWRSIPYGRPMANQLAYVLDPDGHLVPPGVPGELHLGGTGLAWGYLGASAQTADRFRPDPYCGVPGARMYRTGDLARYRTDGVLDLLGRMDFQVKIAGNRVELGEVEAALRALPGIAEAVAAAPATDGPRALIGYLVPEDGAGTDGETPDREALDEETLRERLRDRLPEYMVPSALTVLERIPLTPNGKVDRGALPAPGPAGTSAAGRPPATPTELTLAEVWRELLGHDRISVEDGFFALGGDSVTCIRLVTRARAAGLELTPRMVFEHQTIGELAAALERTAGAAVQETGTGTGREEAGDGDGLAPYQRHMLSVEHRRPQPGLYVMQAASPLPGDLDEDAFREAWRWLFDRHPILRTSYRDTASGRPRPVVADRVGLPVGMRDLRDMTPDEQERTVLAELDETRLRGFDLERAPLLRVLCYRLSDDARLMVQQHHYSLLDAWSCARLFSELLTAYPALAAGERPGLPAPPAGGHALPLGGRERGKALDFWDGYLRGCPGPWAQEPEAGREDTAPGKPVSLRAEAGVGLLTGLARLSREYGSTVPTLVQLAWAAVLAADSGTEDVVFGVAVSRRLADTETETAVGPYVNTVPVRFAMRDDETVMAAARRLQLERATAEEHGGLELGAMTSGRNPTSVLVFSNFLVDDAVRAADRDAPGAALPLWAQQLGVAHTEDPVRIELSRAEEGLLTFTFAADRPLPEGAPELGGRLTAVLEELAARPDGPVAGLVRRAQSENRGRGDVDTDQG